MKKLFCIFFMIYMVYPIHDSLAQVTYHPDHAPTEAEKKLDQKIKDCVKGNEAFEEDFSFAEWTATLDYYTRKMLQRLSAEHATQIAIEKDRVKALQELIANCEALSSVAAEIEGLHKIYQNEITYEESTQSTGLFEDDEVKASMDTKDVENLKKKLDKLRKKLKITRIVIRIQ